MLMPGSVKVTWSELQQRENPVRQVCKRIAAHSTNEYLLILARPGAVKVFRAVRKIVKDMPGVDVGYDALGANITVEWDSNKKCLVQEGFSGVGIFAPRPPAKATTKQPVFFECRDDQVFWIDKTRLDDQIAAGLKAFLRSDTKSQLAAITSLNITNECYSVVKSYLTNTILALEPKPGVRGDTAASMEWPTSRYQLVLKDLDRNKAYAVFLVRSNGYEVFHSARSLAEKKGFENGWELLDENEPIKFGTGGHSVDKQ
jgi:hypothetical protein